ncbi:helix-turn-helix domain-containing protein [Cyanobacterium sp. IPPAS B-1200]|uniref:helix-turn-helix domain-containing protein n=1 Tax=Cyanobacterium sp. IPPAS B-1200 TaxID=1562720 RepID=UPI0008526ADC|nr:helix-turn-helix transcriptional regulator [Cyanobacterium sp. IPPAS B-1200]
MINSQKTEQITTLSKLIQDAKFSHYLDFSRKTGISELTLHRIDCGLIDQIPLKYIKTIARELNLSLEDFLNHIDGKFSDSSTTQTSTNGDDNLRVQITQEVQQGVMDTLESLLLQLPTLVKVVEKKPDLPASRLIPLLKPLNNLLSGWDIKAIAPVGAIVKYDPQQHELMATTQEKVEKVEIRYVGYRQKDKLLYRAKVSPVETKIEEGN